MTTAAPDSASHAASSTSSARGDGASAAPAESSAVADRRTLRYDSMAAILADVNAITAAPVRSLGRWTPAQNIDHVRRVITLSRQGGDVRVPFVFRLLGRLLKKRVLTSMPKAGFKIPSGADFFVPPDDITLDEALRLFRDEMTLADRPGAMTHPSPLLGPMSHDDWVELHCRHAELHFGFLVPDHG